MRGLLAAAVVALGAAGGAPHRAAGTGGELSMVQTMGPVTLGAGGMQMLAPATFVMRRDGWLTGYRIELFGADGSALPATLLHHAELIDESRRSLFRDRIMRVASVSHDTPELTLPLPLGYPVRAGGHLLVTPMLVDPFDHPVTVTVRVTVRWRPARPGSEITSVATFDLNAPGKSSFDTGFDVPVGRSEHSAEFEVPISGRLLAIGGHLHRYARRLTLVRLDTGDTLYDWQPAPGAAGTDEPAPAVRMWGTGGTRLRAGTRIRLSAIYVNETGAVLEDAGMATAGGVFLPDDWRRWPALDPHDPLIMADRDSIMAPATMGSMSGMRMN